LSAVVLETIAKGLEPLLCKINSTIESIKTATCTDATPEPTSFGAAARDGVQEDGLDTNHKSVDTAVDTPQSGTPSDTLSMDGNDTSSMDGNGTGGVYVVPRNITQVVAAVNAPVNAANVESVLKDREDCVILLQNELSAEFAGFVCDAGSDLFHSSKAATNSDFNLVLHVLTWAMTQQAEKNKDKFCPYLEVDAGKKKEARFSGFYRVFVQFSLEDDIGSHACRSIPPRLLRL
jgi:hypothetical protein